MRKVDLWLSLLGGKLVLDIGEFFWSIWYEKSLEQSICTKQLVSLTMRIVLCL